MQERVPDLQTGIFAMPEPDYRMAPGISQSALKEMARSPAHFKHRRENPEPPTPAMVLGTAFHSYVLETELFYQRFAVAPCDDKRTKAWKDAEADCEPGKTLLKLSEFEQVKAMTSAIRADSFVKAILKSATGIEQAAFWQDRVTGVQCKALADIVGKTTLFDIKTAQAAHFDEFKWSVRRYGYDLQGAYYLDGFCLAGSAHFDSFCLIVVEKDPPHEFMIWQLTDKQVSEGRAKYRKYLQTYADCLASNSWPGYPRGINLFQNEENDHEPF